MSLDLTGWRRPDTGTLFVVTGASGTGKTTLVQSALRTIPDLTFSVSATTRHARTGEVDGQDYNFVSHDQFLDMVDHNAFLEWAEVYGNRYGTPREPVQAALLAGQNVILEIDAQGAAQVRRSMPECVSIFILPPSVADLEIRLRARSTDTDDIIAGRIAQADAQLQTCGTFDYLIVNDKLDSAIDQFHAIIVTESLRTKNNSTLVSRFSTDS